MTYKKYTSLTLLIYLLAFFLPAFGWTLDIQMVLIIVTYLLGAGALIFLYQKQTVLLSFEEDKMSKGRIAALGFVGIFLAILLQNIAINIEMFFGGQMDSANTDGIINLVLKNPLMMLAVMVGGPIMEEFVFRRAILGAVTRKTNVWLGVIVSSLLFALMHQDGHLLLYSALGAFFSLQYVITGSIWTSIITHVGMNSLVVIANLLVEIFDIPMP
ncbi:CPBP family intramembrane glutamic endopeptidase [Enterococcus sp. LJL98]